MVEVDQYGQLVRASGSGYLLNLLNEDKGILGIVARLKKEQNLYRHK